MCGYIYKITNTLNNKIYIGLTTSTIAKRFNSHICSSRKIKDPRASILHNAMAKYENIREVFSIEQIDVANSIEELKEKEIYWIKFYDSTNPSIGYNMTFGGEGANGYHHNEKTKHLISIKTKGKKKSEATRHRMIVAQRKLALTRHIIPNEETRLKMSKSHKGHKTSLETKQKLSIANKGKKRTDEMTQQNSLRQVGKKILHNDEYKLNIYAFKEDIDELLNCGWKFGKVIAYKVLKREIYIKTGKCLIYKTM